MVKSIDPISGDTLGSLTFVNAESRGGAQITANTGMGGNRIPRALRIKVELMV